MRKACNIFLFFLAATMAAHAQSSYSDVLSRLGKLAIPLDQAKALESKIGQLLVVNVDGFGYSGTLALEPAFAPLLRDLQIGGVIPHYGSVSYERIRRTNRALQEMTSEPLLICSDIVKLQGSAGVVASFGDGYVGGFLGRFRGMQDAPFSTLARLNAFVLAGMGVNVALGPTVDTSTGEKRVADRARMVLEALKAFGIEPVLKHFPYLPSNANLHHASPDTKVAPVDAAQRFAVFGDLAADTDIVMTTHLYDSLVDKELVTFSAPWNALLRSATGYKGLLMSDGLLMLKNYTNRTSLSGGPAGADAAGLDEAALWAARAILAGHDMVIVEGSAAQTVRVFNGLLTMACRNTALGRQLRAYIEQSYARIVELKKDKAASLRHSVDITPARISAVIALLPTDSTNLISFSFPAAGLAALEPAMKSASFGR